MPPRNIKLRFALIPSLWKREIISGTYRPKFPANPREVRPLLKLPPGVYLASAHHHWGQTFTTVGLSAIAIIAVVGGAVIVPSTRRLATLTPNTPVYDTVFRRYMTAEITLAAEFVRTGLVS